jgi:hypothetical protein
MHSFNKYNYDFTARAQCVVPAPVIPLINIITIFLFLYSPAYLSHFPRGERFLPKTAAQESIAPRITGGFAQ